MPLAVPCEMGIFYPDAPKHGHGNREGGGEGSVPVQIVMDEQGQGPEVRDNAGTMRELRKV